MSQKQRIKETEVSISTPIQSVDESLDVLDRLTDNAQYNILPARYLLRDDEGNVTEDPEDLFSRVAENVAKAEESDQAEAMWGDEFADLMETLRFMPNSPTLMNAGADLQQLSACFVLEPDDDMDDIFKSSKDAALIFKSGGGVGYTFSQLRPQGAVVSSTGGVSSGPISFMEVFDTTCGTVEQGGKRRGAQMGILRVDHADIGRFACAKRTEGDLDNFNISVAITDEFIDAVKADDTYTFYDPQTDYEDEQDVLEETVQFYSPEYANNPESWEDDGEGELVSENIWRDYADDIQGLGGESLEDKWADEITLSKDDDTLELPARFVWDILVDGAWRNGEPGLFYYDETNRQHSFDAEEHPKHSIEATNPCAEQPLSEFEACNLGHVNLSLMLREDTPVYKDFDGSVEEYVERAIDYDTLDRTIVGGTRFLDNVVTMSEFPLDEISERVKGQRKIGLGIMGFAQMLFQMGIEYGSDESYEVARNIMRYIDWQSKQTSHSLAKERGSFDYWEESKYASPMEYPEWFENHVYEDPSDWEDGYPIRNHNTTTIAPTGTTSMIGDTTGGCEPAFNVANFKNVGGDIQGDDMLVEFDDYFLEVLEANGYDPGEIKEEAENLMRNNEFDGPHDLSIDDEIADIFVTTGDLSSEQHTRMQRAFQEFVDSGISKTINLPNDADHRDVHEAYLLALTDDDIGSPSKGLTVYRDGSRDEQVLTTRVDNKLDETDTELHTTLAQLRESGELSDVAAMELGLLEEGESALCPECGEEMNPDGEGCSFCPECFYSPCK